ncbi:flippase [Candidatus Woesearchaeota archaeon]|nr:flippase [Candidatus Woesearchaeota archaeon]
MTNYTKKAVWGMSLVAVGLFFANVFGYLLRLLLADKLTVAEYGLVFSVMAFFGLISIFRGFGLSGALVKYVSEALAKKKYSKIKEYLAWTGWIIFLTDVFIVIVGFLLADWLGAVYFKNDSAALLVRIFAITLIFQSLTIVTKSSLQAYQRMGLSSLFEILRSLFLFVATAILLWAGYGVAGVMYAYLVAFFALSIIFMFIMGRVLKKPLSTKTKLTKIGIKKLFRFGLPMMFAGMASLILSFSDTFLLTLLSTLEEVGLYQVAQPTANLLLFIPVVLSIVMFPIIAELWAKKKKGLIEAAAADLYAYAFLAMCPLIIGFVAFRKIIINLLFGAKYLAGSDILLVLAFSVFFLVLNAINTALISGIGKPKIITISIISGAILNIILNLLLIPLYGGLGVAIATLVSSITIFLVSTILLKKEIIIRPPIIIWAKSIFCGFIFWSVLTVGRFLPMAQIPKAIIALVLAGGAYALCMLFVGAIKISEIKKIIVRVL